MNTNETLKALGVGDSGLKNVEKIVAVISEEKTVIAQNRKTIESYGDLILQDIYGFLKSKISVLPMVLITYIEENLYSWLQGTVNFTGDSGVSFSTCKIIEIPKEKFNEFKIFKKDFPELISSVWGDYVKIDEFPNERESINFTFQLKALN